MAQNYPDIPSTETLQNSRQKLLERDDAVASCFSGTTFPTSGLTVGMLCLRTDEFKLYQLKSTGPDVWVAIADISKSHLSKEEAQALFAALAHAHDDRYFTEPEADGRFAAVAHNHDAAYQAKDADLTAIAGLTAGGLIERTGDGLAQAVPVTAAGKALLDDASAAAQRTTLGLSDAATTSVATIRAGVDLASRVAKAGDTMTGTLTGPQYKTSGSIASNTGFKIADGSDLAALFKAASYAALESVTTSVGNCAGDFGYQRLSSASLSKPNATTVQLNIAWVPANCNCDCY